MIIATQLQTLFSFSFNSLMALKAVTSTMLIGPGSYAYLLRDSICLSPYVIGCGSSTISIW